MLFHNYHFDHNGQLEFLQIFRSSFLSFLKLFITQNFTRKVSKLITKMQKLFRKQKFMPYPVCKNLLFLDQNVSGYLRKMYLLNKKNIKSFILWKFKERKIVWGLGKCFLIWNIYLKVAQNTKSKAKSRSWGKSGNFRKFQKKLSGLK